ncbi:MAG: hydroxymethylbilane synthase [Chloroflexota bacterium]|nr:hydroxymethylbilane synthase [Chloroflexota bacterium]
MAAANEGGVESPPTPGVSAGAKPGRGGPDIVRVGTRASALARLQTDLVLERLRPLYPDLDFQVVTVTTHGDANQAAPLAGMGLGVFVKEIEQQLIDGRLDMAVHSLKDMPTLLPEGLGLAALLPREDPRDVLVNRFGCRLEDLPQGALIGTSSPRRQSQLLSSRPDLTVVPIRGNVETRLRKSEGEECDGAILAAAGLLRLGLADQVTEYLSPQTFVPPPGQGILAVETRADDDRMAGILRAVDHAATRYAATAERAFLERLCGGCQVPVGAYAQSDADLMNLTVFLGSPDGKQTFQAKVRGLTRSPHQLAADAHLAIVERGGGTLLANASNP